MATNKNTTKKPLLKSTETVIVTKTKVPASETLFSDKVKEMNQLLAKTTFMSR